jgi:hypothetical protein
MSVGRLLIALGFVLGVASLVLASRVRTASVEPAERISMRVAWAVACFPYASEPREPGHTVLAVYSCAGS